ncbi:hypothetical protein BC832DRAFT_543226 [Gaertneriomyces semiglobifer]|nr:hypothetical protein BC832DRAFT_543226 [Gaertneriomyces semiglobifer]
MDTNKDGKFDFYDDPYSPYYPGDNYVDWVGLSMYHGQPPMSSYSFYQMFSGDGRGPNVTSPVSRGSKPFMVAETAATFHLTFLSDQSAVNPGPGMLAIKKAWWEQIFNTNFLAKFPKIKGVCTFEFKKDEEYTVREFRSLGDKDADNGKAENEENQVLRAFRDHLFGMGNQIVWATQTGKDTSSALAVKGALAVSVAGTMLASLAFLF